MPFRTAAPLNMRRAVLWAGAGLVSLAAFALIVAWSGVYNVAASQRHWGITAWFLEFAMASSVRTQSMFIEPPALDDLELVRWGAGQFELVCAACHGSPSVPVVPVASAMLPSPPSIGEAAEDWEDEELFWIIKHGLKYTGMPGWVAPERDDEVWALMAFVRRLPEMDRETYGGLTRGNLPDETARNLFDLGATEAETSCMRCHGGPDSAPVSSHVPRLAGQRAAYLRRAMEDYALGRRGSGIMQPIAAALSEEQREGVADHYAGLEPAPAGSSSGSLPPAQVERGRKIATEGVSESGIPPCLSCHGASGHETFPTLAGQSAAYIEGQLALWRRGLRDQTTHGAIMAPIARRLSDSQIADIAAFLAAQGEVGRPDDNARGSVTERAESAAR